MPRIDNVGAHPITRAQAAALCNSLVGVTHGRTFLTWRREWWDHLRGAETPEEKLTCEHMIDAINTAIGLHDPERGLALAAANRDTAERAAAVDAKARVAAAVSRWR